MKVEMLKKGRFAGPSALDPQIEVKKVGEIVNVNAATAQYLVKHKNAKLCLDDEETDAEKAGEEEVEPKDAPEVEHEAKTKKGKAAKAGAGVLG